MSEADSLLAILRRHDGLHALHVSIDEDGSTTEELRPVRDRTLTTAWASLAAIDLIEPSLLGTVRTILEATVRDPLDKEPSLPPLLIAPPPPPHRPTAANPRAYKGTKDRPQKPKRPQPTDLRLFLRSAVGQDRLLKLLTSEETSWPEERRDLPNGLQRYLSFSLRGVNQDQLKAFIHWFHQLNLKDDTNLLRGVGLLLTHYRETSTSWLPILASIDRHRRGRTLYQLTAYGFGELNANDFAIDLIEALNLIPDESYDDVLFYLLDRLSRYPDEAQALLFSVKIRKQYGAFKCSSDDRPPRDSVSQSTIVSFLNRYPKDAENYARDILDAAGESPSFALILQKIIDADLQDKEAHDLACGFAWLIDEDNPEAEWNDALRHLDDILAEIKRTPESHRQNAIYLVSIYAEFNASHRLDYATRLMAKTCKAPLPSDGDLEKPLEVLGRAPYAIRDRFLDAPESSWLALSKAAHRTNASPLVANGLIALIREIPDFAVEMFIASPSPLLKVARSLGFLSRPIRDRIVKGVSCSEIIRTAASFESATIPELLNVVDEYCGKFGAPYVPKRLRQFAAGQVELTSTQLENLRRKLIDSWLLIVLAAIKKLVDEQLKLGLIDEENTDLGELAERFQHALLMQAELEENRRGLRKLLRACFDGDADYLANHPKNQKWLREHPKISASLLTQGIKREYKLENEGAITLALETDPLEALRLGTYVGSCLGLGGSFVDSAAATVLDINKQVVFARDAKKKFLARQVIGISDDGKLVPFAVYPKVDAALSNCFRDYTLAFAKALGIALAAPYESEKDNDTSDESTVSKIVSHTWWDDGVWDLKPEE